MIAGVYSNIHNAARLQKSRDKLVWIADDSEVDKVTEELGKLFPQYQWKNDLTEEVDPSVVDNKIAFYLQSDTLVRSAIPIINRLNPESFQVFIPAFDRENSDKQCEQDGVKFSIASQEAIKAYGPDLFVLFNDWTKSAKHLILSLRKIGVPTICIQESMIDFGENQRMQFSDAVCLQGKWYLNKLDAKFSMITGNPRYESLAESHFSSDKKILVNCNFTYGIYEDKRIEWLDDVCSVLSNVGVEYAISQHPRDRGDLGAYKNVLSSSAATVQSQLEGARILVTRFSSLIHEALFYKIPVVYYNPHGERQIENLEVDTLVVKQARTVEELENAIRSFDNDKPEDYLFTNYIRRNCIPSAERQPSLLISEILCLLKIKAQSFTIADRFKMFLYQPLFRKMSLFLRRK